MLDATEDGNDDRPASSRKEGFPEAIKADVGDRMVYKLVKVGDDGSVLAATEEDEVFQSLIGGQDNNGLSPLDPDVSDAVEDDEDKEGSDNLSDGDGDDSSLRATTGFPIQELAVERQKLKAQIEVLDCILMRVDIEEHKRLNCSAEKESVTEPPVAIGCHEGEGSQGDYKRQRRPNPKYFDYDAGCYDSILMAPPPPPPPQAPPPQAPISSNTTESMQPMRKQPARRTTAAATAPAAPVILSPRVTSGWGRSGHRARTSTTATAVLPQAPRSQKSGFKNNRALTPTKVAPKEDQPVSLENLSIRQLHEAFCSLFGRATSVKDKHWLKRQISAGRMKQQELLLQCQFKARLDRITTPQAEQPLPNSAIAIATPAVNTVVGLIDSDCRDLGRDAAANEAHVLKASEDVQEHTSFRDYSFRSCRLRGSKSCFQRRVTTTSTSTTAAAATRDGKFGISAVAGSLNGSTLDGAAAGGQAAATGIFAREVVNCGEVVVGKRQRKPNRRYIEDPEAHEFSIVPVHDSTRSAFYYAGDITDCGTRLNSSTTLKTNCSWRNQLEADHNASSDHVIDGSRHGTVKGSTLRNVSGKKFSPIQRPKFISIGMKRKVGGRAAKLVKMAHSTARSACQDSEAVIRKAKFRLPSTTPDLDVSLVQSADMIPEMMGESAAGNVRASNGIPMHVVQFDFASAAAVAAAAVVVQPLGLSCEGGGGELQPGWCNTGTATSAETTIPTAKGGTRRKHHRPWTLREVMKLVEGVARCGGGKWADIKKLAFSTVAYRTAVDLKDKWRNLLRASRAQLHPTKQGERKKQFTAAMPAPILARVRELASLPNPIPSGTVSSSSTSRSGRIVHKK